MKGLAKLNQLGKDIVLPRHLILLDVITLTHIIELLNEPGLGHTSHLEVGLNLNHLIEANLVE